MKGRRFLTVLLLGAIAVWMAACDSGGRVTPTIPPVPTATVRASTTDQATTAATVGSTTAAPATEHAVATDTAPPAGQVLTVGAQETYATTASTNTVVSTSGGVSQETIDRAKTIITQLSQGDFTGVETQFDETMQAQVPTDKLKSAWTQLVSQYGVYKGQKSIATAQQQGFDMVVVTSQFQAADLNIRLVFGKDGRVAGLFFQPAAPSTPPAYIPPPYVDQTRFTEKNVTVGSGEWQLPGTLSMPTGQGPFPGVVLVQGSGPLDRDETIGLNKPFRDLAWGLASQGVAVLRYDKRTFVYQQKVASMMDKITVKEEVTDDAALALDVLKNTAGVDPNKFFLLGHSLGAMLVPMIVQQRPSIAGAIVMAGPTRPFEDITLDQATYIANLDGIVTGDEQQQLNILKNQVANVKKPDLSPSTLSTDLPLGLPATYWLSIRGYHPEQVAAGQTEPMFIMQGERDYQVKLVDFEGWKNALSSRSNVTLKTYPKVNHIFKEGEGMGTPDEYNMPGHMSEEVVRDVGDWIKKQ